MKVTSAFSKNKGQSFVNESEGVFIDPKDYDLARDFDILNTMMFEGKLPKCILKFYKSKHKIGLYEFNKKGVGMNTIKISTTYKLTQQTLRNVLAHEMIHHFIASNNIVDNAAHGRKFESIRKELNRKHKGFEIMPKEDAALFSVSTDGSTGLKYIALVWEFDGDYGITVVNGKVKDKDIHNFVADFRKYMDRQPMHIFARNKYATLKIYRSDFPDLATYKVKRSMKLSNFQIFGLDKADIKNYFLKEAKNPIVEEKLK